MNGKYHIPLLPDRTYHLFNRAIGDEKIFKSHENHLYFLDKYTQHTLPICDTWAYCLLPNHFHFLIRVKQMHQIKEQYKLIKTKGLPEHDDARLSDFIMERFSNWLNGYTKAFNKMYGRRGSLFIDYTKRSLVEGDASFAKLVHYIHANPVHHGYVKQIYDWHYSSYKAIISSGHTKLLRNEMLNWFGGKEQFIKYHEQPVNLKSDNSEFS